jgi:IS605 OrfB family transposase
LEYVKLVANIQLKPTREQADLLRRTLQRSNEACSWLSQRGFEAGTTRQFDLHKLAYAEARSRFEIAAQVAVRCIAKVADAYTTHKANGREPKLITFRKHAAQPYDDRIFRLMTDAVSIWTLEGRQTIPFVCGERQRKLLAFRKGEVDLMLVKGKWYLAIVCDVPDPAEIDVEGVLGVDFGVVNIAFDSQGNGYSGDAVEDVRSKLAKRKAGLQRRGTKAAKRRLRKLARKEARFRSHVNHCISKELVARAERQRFAIAVEDLTHIRKRVRARKSQRNRLHSWSFAQLRGFVTYKAKLAGVPMVAVDPRHTSQQCPCCGVIDRANRKSQALFLCISCGHTAPADYTAAINIAAKAVVARPPVLTPSFGVGKSHGL